MAFSNCEHYTWRTGGNAIGSFTHTGHGPSAEQRVGFCADEPDFSRGLKHLQQAMPRLTGRLPVPSWTNQMAR